MDHIKKSVILFSNKCNHFKMAKSWIFEPEPIQDHRSSLRGASHASITLKTLKLCSYGCRYILHYQAHGLYLTLSFTFGFRVFDPCKISKLSSLSSMGFVTRLPLVPSRDLVHKHYISTLWFDSTVRSDLGHRLCLGVSDWDMATGHLRCVI